LGKTVGEVMGMDWKPEQVVVEVVEEGQKLGRIVRRVMDIYHRIGEVVREAVGMDQKPGKITIGEVMDGDQKIEEIATGVVEVG
jgi:hypothetical protein